MSTTRKQCWDLVWDSAQLQRKLTRTIPYQLPKHSIAKQVTWRSLQCCSASTITTPSEEIWWLLLITTFTSSAALQQPNQQHASHGVIWLQMSEWTEPRVSKTSQSPQRHTQPWPLPPIGQLRVGGAVFAGVNRSSCTLRWNCQVFLMLLLPLQPVLGRPTGLSVCTQRGTICLLQGKSKLTLGELI